MEAIRVRDYPLIQGYVIWMAVIYVVVNLLVDLFYQFCDPKIRLNQINQIRIKR
ncbi:MAG: ABC transporter permease subunit [Lachnospiraceae bacterium]